MNKFLKFIALFLTVCMLSGIITSCKFIKRLKGDKGSNSESISVEQSEESESKKEETSESEQTPTSEKESESESVEEEIILPDTEGDYKIEFVVDGMSFYPIRADEGEKIEPPYIKASEQQAGKGLNWYTDETYTELYTFDEMPAQNFTLYGKWEVDTGTGFLKYEDPENMTIVNLNGLKTFYDYVLFERSSEYKKANVTYLTNTALTKAVESAAPLLEFRGGGDVEISSSAYMGNILGVKSVLSLRVTNTNIDEASLTVDDCVDNLFAPVDYKMQGNRDENFDDFYIDRLPFSYNVTTSNQLMYVVEHGFKPICASGSPAEKMYEKAKDLSRQIISDDFSTYEKVKAIYDYITINVKYDDNALDDNYTKGEPWQCFDSYYLEGVLNNKKAVCDGKAKTFSLLCNMEGIPCVEVTGNAHAWCKVKVNNEWYIVDPTHGRSSVGSTDDSFYTRREFLITESAKANKGYSSYEYSNIVAEGNLSPFTYETYTYNGVTSDYVVETVSELAGVMEYCIKTATDLNYKSIDVLYNVKDMQFLDAVNKAMEELATKKGINLNSYSVTMITPSYGECGVVMFKKR